MLGIPRVFGFDFRPRWPSKVESTVLDSQWAGLENADFRATDSGSAVSPHKDGVGTLFPDLRLVESTSPYPTMN